ncbi:MAG: PAS domain S-box protein, partial [Nitrospirae bacterium]|nr:PAS domain S-box protein [Nitrospirota bacterium]
MNILIVDDDPGSRKLLRLLIEGHGHSVLEASDGQEGLEKALEHRPDAIISDAVMPRMDGFQFLHALRHEDALRNIPFILFTAIYTGDDEHELARSLGADALIVKPKPPDAFWEEFTAALAMHASGKEPTGTASTDEKKEEERFRDYCRVVAAKLEEKLRELEQTRAVLQDREERYRTLFENNPQPMWVFDLETLAFLAVNDAAVAHYGYSKEEFLSLTIKDIRPAEDVPALLGKISKVSRGIDEAGVWRHRKKDGTIIEVEIVAHTMVFAGRRSQLVSAIDVTERRRLETEQKHNQERLARSEQRYRNLVDTAQDVIFSLDDAGTVVSLNPVFETITGWPLAELIGRSFTKIVHRDDLNIALDNFHRVMQGESPPLHVLRILNKAGGHLYAEILSKPNLKDGGVAGLFGIARDITKRIRLEDALKEALVRAGDEKARADSIIAAIGDGVTIQDRDFRVLYQNQAFKNLLGEHVGECCYMAYEKRDQRCEGCGVAMVFEDGEVHSVVRSAPTDKGTVYVEITASPLRDSKGNIIAGIEVVHNITERMKTSEALEQQKQFTENLIQNSAVATFVLDAQHTILIWNRACEELTGFQASEMIGTADQWKPFYDHQRPALADVVMDADGDPEKLSSLYSVYSKSLLTPMGLHAEGWYKNMNGRDRYVVFDAAPIINTTGVVIAAIETLQDITARKLAEEQLSQITREWEETFNTITDMVTVHDKDFNIIRANKAAQKILGLPFLDVKKVKCFEYFHGAGCPPEGCPSCHCLVSGKPSIAEVFEPHLKMHIEIQAIP